MQVNGATLRFLKAIIATGGRASLPPFRGLESVPFLTNATLFNLTALPPRMVVLGGGASRYYIFIYITLTALPPRMVVLGGGASMYYICIYI